MRTSGYDPTETAGHGLLHEMSIAELWERIEYEKIWRQVETDEKWKEILSKNEEHADLIKGKAQRVHEERLKAKLTKD